MMNVDLFDHFLKTVSKKKRHTIKKIKHAESAQKKLLSEVLARFVIIKTLGITNENIQLERSKYGKPFLKYHSDFHFNLSNSGQWIVCACSNQAIGIDIEMIRPIDLDIASMYFSADECKYLEGFEHDLRIEKFIDLWTQKECLVKAEGKGLFIPLDKFSLSYGKDDKIYVETRWNDLKGYHFHRLELDNKYKCTLCTREREIKFSTIQYDSLASFYKEWLEINQTKSPIPENV